MVVGPGFDSNARVTGSNQGVPALQTAVYPGPFDLHTDEQLRDNIESIVFPRIIEALTKTVTEVEGAETEPADPKEIVFTGTVDDVNRLFTNNQWSDGLAIVPPTVKRVEEFLKYTDIPLHEEICVLSPSSQRVTPWNIAVHGVMAGCRPEYMPLLIAMVKSLSTNTGHLGSTHSWIPIFEISGPVARQLNIDHGQGLIAAPANAVIGRALGLVVTNLVGYRLKELRMGSFGYIQPYVLSEDEESLDMIGWEPFNVEKGFDRNVSTVSMGLSTILGSNAIPAVPDPDLILQIIAYDIINKEAFGTGVIGTDRTVLMCPTTAQLIAKAGYTKESVKTYLRKVARKVTYTWTFSQIYGSPGHIYPPFKDQLSSNLKKAEKGKLPPWYPRFDGWEEIETTPSIGKGIDILVCGDPSRNKVQILAGSQLSAHTEIQLPENWDALMEDLGYSPLVSFYRGGHSQAKT